LKRTIRLALERFGRDTLEDQASHYALSREELVGRAARYFVRHRDSGRAALRVPRFQRERLPSGGLELELDLDPAVWEALADESRRQGVAIERVLEHAVLYLVADLDSGEVAADIAEHEPPSAQ
jgi:hypothetical protein